MELTWIIIVGILFCLAGLVAVVSVVVGLPGAWMIIGLAIAIEFTDSLYIHSGRSTQTFPWWLIGAGIGLAVIGEILEFVAGAVGAKTAGSSRRGMYGALIGGIVGAIGGIFIPIPILGSLIGAIIGTFVGAVFAETHRTDTTIRASLKPATGASIGRLLGTASKVPIAVAIWAAFSVAAFWP